MRRKERQITNREEIDAILRKGQICRIALFDGNEPYIVPLCYGYDGAALYFHCALQGRKLEILKINPKVAFEVSLDIEFVTGEVACDWGLKYRSVIGVGFVSQVTDPVERQRALALIMKQYSDREYDFEEISIARTCVVKVAVQKISGKKARY
jgi:uncharacterized protein